MPTTHPASRACFWAVSALLLAAATVSAQPPTPGLPTPRLLTVMPPGGKVGTTVEVTFTGQNLEDPERLLFSHPGIKSEPIVPPPPPPLPGPPLIASTTSRSATTRASANGGAVPRTIPSGEVMPVDP